MTTPTERTTHDNPPLVWAAAVIVAVLGAWIMFDAMPGVNWGIWTAGAALGLIIVARDRGTLGNATLFMVAVAILISAGAAVTADEFILGLTCLAVILFLALAMLLAVDPGLSTVRMIASPVIAAGTALYESFRRGMDLTRIFHSDRARATVRGIAITIPIVVVFALLLASADPIFAGWRDEIGHIIETWSFIPRAIFFLVLLTIVLGAYSFASRGQSSIALPIAARATGANTGRWLGATERLILVSAVTGLFWLFIAVQLSYLFGNVPSVRGSGMTFADYARQGFGELTFVATCSALLILLSERYGRTNGNARKLTALTIALLTAVVIILGSAFYRVLLYEAAYGYTVSRLYAQVYMIVLAIALVALAAGVLTTLDTGVLFRRMFAVATTAFLVLVFWNHEAWIASANIRRYETTGKLDVSYLTRDLSPNAVPVIVSQIASLPEPKRTELHNAVVERYATRRRLADDRWFEWNYRRHRARAALATIGLPLPTVRPVVVTSR